MVGCYRCAPSFTNLGFSISMGTLFLPSSEMFGTSRLATALVRLSRSKKWLVVIAGCAASFISIGFTISMGALFLPISETFGTNRPATALVQSLTFGMMVTGVIVGSLVERYGVWKMTLVGTVSSVLGLGGGFFAADIAQLYVISAVSGFGMTMMLICGTVAVESVTEGRAKSAALAINASSIGFGALAYPHLLTFLTDTYALNGTYLILAGLFCNNITLVLLTYSLPTPPATHTDEGTFDNTVEAIEENGTVTTRNEAGAVAAFLYRTKAKCLRITSVSYVLTWIASSINFAAVDGYIITCVDIYVSLDFTEQQGITSLTFYSVGNVAAAILGAILKQFKFVNTFAIPVAFSLCGCIGMVMTYFAVSVPMAFTGAVFLGSAEGVLTGALLILAEIVPQDHYGTAFGIILSSLAVISIISGPVVGALRDASGSYTSSVVVIGTILLTTAALFIAAGLVERNSRNKTPHQEPPASSKSATSFDNQTFSPEVKSNYVSDSTYM